ARCVQMRDHREHAWLCFCCPRVYPRDATAGNRAHHEDAIRHPLVFEFRRITGSPRDLQTTVNTVNGFADERGVTLSSTHAILPTVVATVRARPTARRPSSILKRLCS